MAQEHYLLEQWGVCDYKDWIKDWVDDLKNGVRVSGMGVLDICKYDKLQKDCTQARRT